MLIFLVLFFAVVGADTPPPPCTANSDGTHVCSAGEEIRFEWPLNGMEIPPGQDTVHVSVIGLNISEEGNNIFINHAPSGSNVLGTSNKFVTPLQFSPGAQEISASVVDVEGEIVLEQTISFNVADPSSRFGLGLFSWDPAGLIMEPYPYYVMHKVLDDVFYQELKRTFPQEDKLGAPTQLGKRRNLQMGEPAFNEWVAQHPAWQKLCSFMLSQSYMSFVDKLFPDELKLQYGYQGGKGASLSFDISVGSTEYWTPVHADSRGRIAVFLLYFGQDTIESGGEICIVKHKKLEKWTDYPQFPNLSDIEERSCFEPKDNFGMIFLNTPNSYHWPKQVVGTRRFLYVGLNAERNIAWESGAEFVSFKEGIKLQEGLDEWAKNFPDS